jgi:hypothetical protein
LEGTVGTLNNVVIGNLVDLSAVSDVLSRLTQRFPDFRPGGPAWSFANFTSTSLPDFTRLGSIEMRRTWVTGRLSAKSAKIDSLEHLLAAIAQVLLATPAPLECDIGIGFEEKGSKQSKNAFDSIRWQFRNGNHRFGYSANGSRINTDPPYARTAFQELIDLLHLPLSIRENTNGFVLGHTAKGAVDILRSGIENANPSAFYCDIAPLTSSEISALLLSALRLRFSGKLIESCWSVRTSPPHPGRNPDDTTESPQVFRFLSNATVLHAATYELQLEPRLRTLADLESLRPLMNARDSLLLPVGAFTFGPNAFANVDVRATSNGFAVEIASRLPLPTGVRESLT